MKCSPKITCLFFRNNFYSLVPHIMQSEYDHGTKMGDENRDYIKLYDREFFQNISASYITMTNIQSKIDLLKQRAIDLEAENAKLKQIIKENAKRKADNVNLSAENSELKIKVTKFIRI